MIMKYIDGGNGCFHRSIFIQSSIWEILIMPIERIEAFIFSKLSYRSNDESGIRGGIISKTEWLE